MALLHPGVLHGGGSDLEDGGLLSQDLVKLLAQLPTKRYDAADDAGWHLSQTKEEEEVLMLDDQGETHTVSLPGRFPRWWSYCGTPR